MAEQPEIPDAKVLDVLKTFTEHCVGIRDFREMLRYESDRGCALAAAAFLDERLKKLLLTCFTEECADRLLNGADAPLGTFSSRILAAQGLSLIPPKGARDLGLIRKIRNEFAHQLDYGSFDVPKVTNLCRELHYCFSNPNVARNRFTDATTFLLALIDFTTVRYTRPVPAVDWTQEKAQKHSEVVELWEHAVWLTEKHSVESSFGISASTPLPDLIKLAVENGMLESQPPRKNLPLLAVLERLIMERAQVGGAS